MRRSEAEFAAFVAARRPHLRRIAFALCGDWHQAEDLVQTALAKLYVAWPRIHRDGAEEAYARQVIVRANIDESRRPWRRETPVLEQPARELDVSTGTVKSHTSRALAALHALLADTRADLRSTR